MTVEWLLSFLRRSVSKEQLRDMFYLERHGYRVAVDFGTDNAIALARVHRRDARRKKC